MNAQQLEDILRRAPQPPPPSGLKERLHADIELPLRTTPAAPPRASGFSFRSWFPAVAFSLAMLMAVVLLAVQTNQLLQLRATNHQLRASLGDLESLRAAQSELQARQAQLQELEQLRKDAAESQRLQAEIAQLQAQGADLPQLQAQQQQLRANLAAAAAAAPAAETDPLAEARDKARSIACINNLKQIGLAARIWANKNQDVLPLDFPTLLTKLGSAKCLVCPSDTARLAAVGGNWQNFDARNGSYELLSPGIDEKDPNVVYCRCPIHGHVGLVDGSAHSSSPERPLQVIEENGKLRLAPRR